ncbi:MAG TPA: hypothetical protein VGC41_14960 [Kofleriaceae bacterium]
MREVGEKALAWVIANEANFAADAPLWFAKRNGELALVAALLLDAGDERGRPLLQRAWERFEAGAWLVREAPNMPALATVYPPFWRHGFREPVLEQTFATTSVSATDPALRLLLACAHRNCELPPPWNIGELLATGELATRPATWEIDTRFAYLAMHVAWAGPLPAELATYVRRSLPAWISWFVRTGEIDLLGEAIMTSHVLGDCVPPAEWRVLGEAQEADGLVPFKQAWRGREVPARARFEASYHSTLVALGAAALCTHAE